MARTPSLRLHKPSGQAVVTLGGRDHYLGPHGTRASREAYDRLLAEWLAAGRPQAATAQRAELLGEVLADYVDYARDYYRPPSTEISNILQALRPLKTYIETPADAFGPKALRGVLHTWANAGLARTTINKRKGIILRFFRWAVSMERIPAATLTALQTVEPLRRGRTPAREPEPRQDVPWEIVDATLPHLSATHEAIVLVLWYTGARPGEILSMRCGDIDRSDADAWRYTPRSHKNAHRGQARTICIGPRAQAVLQPWLKDDTDAVVFSPRDAVRAWRESRKVPHRSERDRARSRQAKRKAAGATRPRLIGETYDARALNRAIRRACQKHGIEPWTPYQLRHAAATRLAEALGFEAARKVLGQRTAAVTQRYVHESDRVAAEAMKQAG